MSIIYEPPRRHCCDPGVTWVHHDSGMFAGKRTARFGRYSHGDVWQCECGITWVYDDRITNDHPGGGFMLRSKWRREGRFARWRRERRSARLASAAGVALQPKHNTAIRGDNE